MDRQIIAALSRENPRNLPLTLDRAMPNDPQQKPQPPTILDRFKALVKLRDDEDLSPLSTDEIVRLYEFFLSELTFNSKPIITDLTIIAGEQREYGKGIADAICARIIEAPVDQKLPSLYLLDSIVKNIGREYVRHFASRLPEVFIEAYQQVDPSMYGAMRHLFGTWSTVFPLLILRKIEYELQFSSSDRSQAPGLTSLRSSESPRPSHSIHVNPKYVQQVEHSGADSGAQRLSTAGQFMGPSRSLNSDHLLRSSNVRLGGPLSPSRDGADRPLVSEYDEFPVRQTPRTFERASPSHPALEFSHGRSLGHKNHYSEEGYNRLESSTASNAINGREHQNLRALIDAYGNDDREISLRNRNFPVDRLDISGTIKNKVGTMSWQDTEEQEYDWEDMSLTLADNSRIKEALPFRATRTRIGSERYLLPPEANIHNKWPGQPRLPSVDDSSISTGIDNGRALVTTNVSNIRSETCPFVGSHYPQETKNFPSNLPQTRDHIASRGNSRNLSMPISSSPISAEPVNVNAVPSSMGMFPPHNLPKQPHISQVHQIPPPLTQQIRGSFNRLGGQDTTSLLLQFDNNMESKETTRAMVNPASSLPTNKNAVLLPLNQCNQAQGTFMPPQIHHQRLQENFVQPNVAASYQVQPPPMMPNHGYRQQSPGFSGAPSSNLIPTRQLPLTIFNFPNSSAVQLQIGQRPLAPTPASSHALPVGMVSNQLTGGAYSGLIGSLMAQGLISLANQNHPAQGCVGVEFDLDILKVRHESAIQSLYGDLPRQCTTCGLRFKSQEEHSSHMDWHVTKNRMAKNRKHKSSRKWFVSTGMWLSGAESLGVHAVPGFLPVDEVNEEKKSNEEMAVPADEDQKECALCGEPFDDYFSDETEEWMYRGAVYSNAPPDGSTAAAATGLDRSQLGPIVHAKCRSESIGGAVPQIIQQGVDANIEEGSPLKRLRTNY